MTPNPDSPGLGFGIALIGKLADDVRFTSSGEGTVISMCFNAAGSFRRRPVTEQGKEG